MITAAAADGPLAPAPRDDAIAADGPLAPAMIVGHIDTPERSPEPIYAVILGPNSGDSRLQDLRREEERARQTYARLLFQRREYE